MDHVLFYLKHDQLYLLRVQRIFFIIGLNSAELALSSPAPLTSGLLGLCIVLSTLLSNTLHLCSSLNVRNQVSDPTKHKVVILCESTLSA